MSRTWTPRIFAVVNFLDSYGCWISPWLPCRQRPPSSFISCERSCCWSSTLRSNLGTSGTACQSPTARDSGMCTLPPNKIFVCCACGSALTVRRCTSEEWDKWINFGAAPSMVSVDHAAHTHASGICSLGALSRSQYQNEFGPP
jgi:hypothetical protein